MMAGNTAKTCCHGCKDTCQMQMRALTACMCLMRIERSDSEISISGNCISWLSRALRTFARTLTMDSHAGTREVVSNWFVYCETIVLMRYVLWLPDLSLSGLDLAPSRASSFKILDLGSGYVKRTPNMSKKGWIWHLLRLYNFAL